MERKGEARKEKSTSEGNRENNCAFASRRHSDVLKKFEDNLVSDKQRNSIALQTLKLTHCKEEIV